MRIVVPLLAMALFATAAEAAPKSNFIARWRVLSANEAGVTIEHSDKGKRAAFIAADEHCQRFGKIAVYAGGSPDFGANTTSTWRCIRPEAG